MISMEHCEYIWCCFIVLTRLLLYHARYTQMSTFVKLVLRYFIFSSWKKILACYNKAASSEDQFHTVGTGQQEWRGQRCWGSSWPFVEWTIDCLPVNWERSKETMTWKRKCSAVSLVTAGFKTHVLTSFQTWIYFKDSREERVCMLELVESDDRRGAKDCQWCFPQHEEKEVTE